MKQDFLHCQMPTPLAQPSALKHCQILDNITHMLRTSKYVDGLVVIASTVGIAFSYCWTTFRLVMSPLQLDVSYASNGFLKLMLIMPYHSCKNKHLSIDHMITKAGNYFSAFQFCCTALIRLCCTTVLFQFTTRIDGHCMLHLIPNF